jgi:phage gp37-like protein
MTTGEICSRQVAAGVATVLMGQRTTRRLTGGSRPSAVPNRHTIDSQRVTPFG